MKPAHLHPSVCQISAACLLLLLTACVGDSDPMTPTPPAPAGPTSTTLAASVSTLALSVDNTGLNAALTGSPRTITVTNTGSFTAESVAYMVSPALPSGTTIVSTCGTLAAGQTCTLTVTPGATPSAAPGDTAPTPVTVSVAGSNTNTVAPTVQVLTYGSVYQSGYVFALDDTTATSGSVLGKVAALTDQAPAYPSGIIWASDGAGGTDYTNIPGIDEISSSPSNTCSGNTDGACNTAAIMAQYSSPTTTPAIDLSLFAAGLCSATIGGYTDWYLPAICEAGDDDFNGCTLNAGSTRQSMQSNLVDNGDIGGLSGYYWSSTEGSVAPGNLAYAQYFAASGGGYGFGADKGDYVGVRCARALTN